MIMNKLFNILDLIISAFGIFITGLILCIIPLYVRTSTFALVIVFILYYDRLFKLLVKMIRKAVDRSENQ